MATYPSSESVIIYQGTNDRLEHAAIVATPIVSANETPAEPVPYQSNEDGIFIIKESDLPLKIEILHKKILSYSVVDWKPDGKRKVLWVTATETNNKPGKVLFFALILSICLLFPLYIWLHYTVDKAGGPLSNLLV